MTQEEFLKRFAYSVSRDRIGGGGFGTVYKAYDNVLHRDAAIKVSEVKTTADGKKTFSLKDEFEALSHVPRHPNIANYEEFYSFETPQGVFDYAVMQYYPDGNLSNAIKEGMTDEQKEEVAMQLLEGIDFLHKHKVVHRDLKPGNILVVKHGGHIIPLITDFGLSKAADTGDGSQFSNSFGGGTQRYSSPEQLQGKPLRFNTDLWSYGAIVYELFTAEQLFSPGSGASNSAQAELEVYNKIIHGDVTKLNKMPERWRKVAERCMVVDPEKRVKSAEELILLLKGYEEATVVDVISLGQQKPQQMLQNTSQPQPIKPVAKPAASKPVNNKPEPPKVDKPQDGKKKRKGLWIGLAALTVIVLALVLLLKPKEEQPVPQIVSQIQVDSTKQKDTIIQELVNSVDLANAEETNVTVEPDPDTEAYEACRTVNDYRNYISEYGRRAKHYVDAKKIVDKHVADSTAKAKELIAQQQAKEKQETEAIAKAEAEEREKEANERAEAAAKELLEKQRKADEAKKANFEAELAQQNQPTNNTNTNSNNSTSSISSSTAKPGFSISSSNRVYFAPGNLQYQPSTKKWRFAPNPWDCIGKANKNISTKSYNGWIDLFGWGTGRKPTKSSIGSNDYPTNFRDWGNNIDGGWRTLTSAEWVYVFYKRNTASGIRYAKATVNGVNGVILLPDNWNSSTHSLNNTNKPTASFSGNSISASTWDSTFAPNGAVFLPAAGSRSETSVTFDSSVGYYWSASSYNKYCVYHVFFSDGDLNPSSNNSFRSCGFSVRLARPAE